MSARAESAGASPDVLVETSHALPLVSFSIALKTGSLLDPDGMSGATRMMTRWMRRTAGGREAHVIDAEIDALGGAFGADVSPSTLVFQGTVITRSLDGLMRIAGDVLARPGFAESELERLRRETLAELTESLDDDRGLSRRWFRHRVFGSHPYARSVTGTPSSLSRIQPAELKSLYERVVRADNLIFAFSGDIDRPRAEALAAAGLEHVRGNDFLYTLSPGRYGEGSPHVIDEFWLDRRLGFCEHFASAFVVVMRSMGVPARIVTGFQGWDAEPQDGYYVVRNANAHAWAEYWVEGRGWVRSDPTAAVAPNRVVQGIALRPAPGVIGQLNPTLWRAMRNGWETINNRWQQLVLNYSRENQFDLLKRMGFSRPDWTGLGQALAGVILVLAVAGWAWIRWSSRPHDAWSRQRSRIGALLAIEVPAHESPSAWARALRRRYGQKAEPAAQWLEKLERSRYAADAPPPPWGEFRAAARMLRA